MEDAGFVLPRENPRNLGYKPMSNEISVQKSLTPILDRFKALLKQRDDEIRLLVGDDALAPPPTTDEIVHLYELVLSELTLNSKPIITDLTIIAGEQREHGEGIAEAICARIIEVPVEQKLPSLYLLDSIVKNIGREYVRHFSARLPEVFCAAYRQVNPNLYASMRHLFGTWSTVFPSSVLRKIEAQLQFSPSSNYQSSSLRASESPRPAHGIHVNPKYLEARRQLEHSSADTSIQNARGTSTSRIHGKPSIGFDEYDSDNAEAISAHGGTEMLTSTGRMGRTAFALDGERRFPSSIARVTARPLSPLEEELGVNNSPRRVTEGASPSRPGFGYKLGGVTGRDKDPSDLRRIQGSDRSPQQFERSATYSNGIDIQNPRALIDAYGTDQGEREIKQKLPMVKKLDINGIDCKVGVQTWQNTEEEEFEWEDMSPTLTERGRTTGSFSTTSLLPESSRMRPGFGAHRSAAMETDFKRGNWSNQDQLPLPNGSSVHIDNSVPSTSSDRGFNKITGFHNVPTEVPASNHPQEAWNLPRSHPWAAQHHFNTKGNGVKSQIPFAATSLAGGQKSPLIDCFPGADAQHRLSSNTASRLNFPSFNTLNPDGSSATIPTSTGAWRPPLNMQNSQPHPILPTPLQKQGRTQFDMLNASYPVANDGPSKSRLHHQQFDSNQSKPLSQLPRFPSLQAGQISFNQQIPVQNSSFPPQFSLPQDVRQNLVPPPLVSNSPHLVVPPMNRGYSSQRYDPSMGTMLLNPVPAMQPSKPVLNVAGTSLHLPGGGLPPLPRGPPPISSHMIPISQNPVPISSNPPPGGAFSGLFSSLVAQGLISLTTQNPLQDSVGLEFDPDILKGRHESAITALYADLPRQCTTCGLRFKSQEEHRSHMDWHVTKNRVSKNRKQKPSRKWFVNVSMWLSSAEALGTDAVPGFLLPSENAVEKKDDEEMAVPADEDQNVCALCGEPFDDFYSDETEEWMYRGAVYMNMPSGSTVGMDKSQLGPIVHAKCRSESNVVPSEDFGQTTGVNIEEGNQRKRMRS